MMTKTGQGKMKTDQSIDLQKLFAYHLWSNQRMQEALTNLNEDEWNLVLNHEFISIHSKCVHLVGALELWLQRLKSQNPTFDDIVETHETMTGHDLLKLWKINNTDLAEFFNKVDSDNSIEGILYHLILHTNYHCGQINMALRMIGKQPVMIDFIGYQMNFG